MESKKILFVCTGNICRSPTAHAIARHKAKIYNKENLWHFDSAGTDSYHEGENSDLRAIEVGKQRGISFANIKSRPINKEDFEKFDLILAMDKGHVKRLRNRSDEKYHHKIKLFLEFTAVENEWNDEVIDPYYGSNKGFEEVFDKIDEAIENLFKQL